MTHYCGSEWVKKQMEYWPKHKGQTMSELGRDVADILGATFAGIYHLDQGALTRANWWNETNISLIVGKDLATYDGNELADLIILCFMMNVRLKIEAATHGYLRLNFCRVGRWGFFRDSMPTLDIYMRTAHVRLADILRERVE